MRSQRDTYAHLNNQVLHLANQGVTVNQVHNVYKLPDSLRNQWSAHSYHGSEEHNSRAVINRYLGYWDANPATLMPLSPEDSAPLYVEMMGGADKIMKKGKKLYDEGKYFYATEILNKLNYAEPENQAAKTYWPMYMNKSVIRKKARVFVTASLRQLSSYAMVSQAVHHHKLPLIWFAA